MSTKRFILRNLGDLYEDFLQTTWYVCIKREHNGWQNTINQTCEVYFVLLFFFAVNIALNKQAYQQYQFLAGNDKYDASNTVDGLRSDLSRNGGQCAISAAKQTATLWVNLTEIHSIHHITIYFMTNDNKWGKYSPLPVSSITVYNISSTS